MKEYAGHALKEQDSILLSMFPSIKRGNVFPAQSSHFYDVSAKNGNFRFLEVRG